MKLNKSWMQSTALALSLPTTIFVLAWALKDLVESKIIEAWVAILIFALVIGNTFFLMIWYSYKNTNKNNEP